MLHITYYANCGCLGFRIQDLFYVLVSVVSHLRISVGCLLAGGWWRWHWMKRGTTSTSERREIPGQKIGSCGWLTKTRSQRTGFLGSLAVLEGCQAFDSELVEDLP